MHPKIVLFVCGSFNPPTNMHLRMFEVARDYLHHMGREVIGAIVSPVHESYGKKDLVSSTHRLNMLRLALKTSDWIKLSDWECSQESWMRTRATMEHHQNKLNAAMHCNNIDDVDEKDLRWLPDKIRNGYVGQVQLKLLCGADLLESFKTPGLWSDEDMETIVGQHGLVVITREQGDPQKFIYESDMLTKYMANITVVTEWFRNEISSTKIRRCLRRGESVKYLISDDVINYIYQNGLYGSTNIEYLIPYKYTLTPSPVDAFMTSPSPLNDNCLSLCQQKLFATTTTATPHKLLTLDTVDNPRTITKHHPGQAIKIVAKEPNKNRREVRMRGSKSSVSFAEAMEEEAGAGGGVGGLRDCKSCDENLVKFIFTKHGIEIISDVETIV